MTIKITDRLPEIIVAGILMTAMIVLHGLTGIADIIFPEAFSLACGLVISPIIPWNCPRRAMIPLMVFGAFVGIGLNIFVPGPVYLRIIAGFVIVMATFEITRYFLAPMISAVILPVMLGTRTILYPVCVAVIITVLCLINFLLEKRSRSTAVPSVRKDFRPVHTLLIILIFAILCCLACFSGYIYLSAPPLIVIFYELCSEGCKAAAHPVKTVLSAALAACSGILVRFFIIYHTAFNCPYVAALLIAGVSLYILVIIIWRVSGVWLPPVGAIACLAIMIPSELLIYFAVEVISGIIIWVAAAGLVMANTGRIENVFLQQQQ